jgi:uncharacterized membrane protein
MIQRIQTVYLAFAAICGILMVQAPLFKATLSDMSVRTFLASESLIVFALVAAVAILSIVAIFLFRNRPTQYKLALIGALLAAVVIGLEVWAIDVFKKNNQITAGSYQWGGLLPIAMMVLLFLASSAINSDEKKVKSLDRLR